MENSSKAAPHVLNLEVAGLFKSETFSDLVVYCGDRCWPAHKIVLCTQSAFFKKACEGGFKEAKTGAITLEEDDPHAVNALLSYLYTNEYEVYPAGATSSETLQFHVLVFALAEKLFVKPLLKVAADRFFESIQANWNISDFAKAITEWATRTTDPGKILGAKMVDMVMLHRDELLRDRDESNKAFQQVMHGAPWLGAEVAQLVHSQLLQSLNVRFFKCENCSRILTANFKPNEMGILRCPYCSDVSSFGFWERVNEETMMEGLYE